MYGVYVIWHAGPNAATVYVGQGFIRDRLTAHRNDPRIQQFSALGLYVTWASVPSASLEAVEKYLADRLGPRVGEAHPNVLPVSVNLPW